MEKEEKFTPSQQPDLALPLTETVHRALEDPEAARDVRIELQIGGGLATQSYRFEFEASGGGVARCNLNCELSGRRAGREKAEAEHGMFTELLTAILDSGVLELPPPGPPFLPDTVVGCLTISDGRNVSRYYFAADPDQAQVQDRPTPEALLKAVDAVYSAGARMLDMDTVKP